MVFWLSGREGRGLVRFPLMYGGGKWTDGRANLFGASTWAGGTRGRVCMNDTLIH